MFFSYTILDWIIRKTARDERGAEAIEYVLIAATLVAIVAVTYGSIQTALTAAVAKLATAMGGN